MLVAHQSQQTVAEHGIHGSELGRRRGETVIHSLLCAGAPDKTEQEKTMRRSARNHHPKPKTHDEPAAATPDTLSPHRCGIVIPAVDSGVGGPRLAVLLAIRPGPPDGLAHRGALGLGL